ncbi:MAG: TonB family protein, partial [Armatimonadota bacterium]
GVVGGAGLATLERGGVASVGGEIRGAGALAGATGSGDPGGAMVRSAGGGGPVVRGGAGVVRAGGGNREIGAAGGVDASVRGGTDVAAGDRSKVPAKGEGGLATRGETGGSAATRNEDASPIARRDVELSSELKRRRFSARVLIQVNVDADGRHTESLLQGSGDSDVDTAVLRALAGWKWEPAYRDGIKVRSTRKFEYRIKVED